MVKKVPSIIKQIPSLHYSGFNSNQMSKEVYDKIKRDVEVNGFLDPYIYYCDDNEIISGNHRVKISRELGLEYTLEYLCLGDLSLEDRIQKAEMFNTRGVPNELIISLNVYHVVENYMMSGQCSCQSDAMARLAGKLAYTSSAIHRLYMSGERLALDHPWMINEVDGQTITTLHAHYLLNMDRTRRTFLGWTLLEKEEKDTKRELKRGKNNETGEQLSEDEIKQRETRLTEIPKEYKRLIAEREVLIRKLIVKIRDHYEEHGKGMSVDTLQAEIRVAYVTDFQEHLPELVDVPWASIWYPEKRVESIRHKIEEGVALGTYKRDWKVPMTRLTRVSSFPMSIAFNLYRLLGSEGGQELKQREMVVVDPFMGMGIRVVTAIIMGHTAYGYDVAKPMPDKIKKAWKLKDVNEADTGILEIWDKLQHAFYVHDSRSLPHKDNSVDLVFTSPPYWLVEKYEGAVEEGQLSKAKTYAEFMKGMYQAYDEMKRIVKPGGYIALVVANFREKGAYIPYADDTCYYFRSDPQLQYHDKIILGHDLSKPTGGTKSIINNHTRLAHEELFVFKRKK